MFRSFGCALAALVAAIAMAFSPAVAETSAKGLVCSFPSGIVKTFENGAFKTKAAEPFSFRIGDINLNAQTASLLTPKGKGDLKIVRAIGANHFLEVITEGFLNITTIYDPNTPGGPIAAVHSRHIGVLGTPVVSQYHGTCKPL